MFIQPAMRSNFMVRQQIQTCLSDCLNQFTAVENIHDVECPFCTYKSVGSKLEQRIQEESMLSPLTRTSISPVSIDDPEINASNASVCSMEDTSLFEARALIAVKSATSCGESDNFVVDLDELDCSEPEDRDIWLPSCNSSDCPTETSLSKIVPLSHQSSLISSVNMSTDAEDNSKRLKHFCSQNRVRTVTQKRHYFTRLPSILCLHLCRRVYGENGFLQKIGQFVKFDLTLDMSPYMAPYLSHGTKFFYQLRSVVVHQGTSDMGKLSLSVFLSFVAHVNLSQDTIPRFASWNLNPSAFGNDIRMIRCHQLTNSRF